MSRYDLGSRTRTAQLDPLNPLGAGFWTVSFAPADMTVNVDYLIYHMSLKGPPGCALDIYRGTAFWDSVPSGNKNGWDPAQPLPMRQGDSLYLYYNTLATPAPLATIWLREQG